MSTADLQLPMRLLAGGGPSTPDARVLRALTTPLIGQFDPSFTAVMDDVVQLARQTFLTSSPHCFGISALASGGLEAVLNSLLGDDEAHGAVAIGGSAGFIAATAELVRRCGGVPVALNSTARLILVPAVDPFTAQALPLRELAEHAHSRGAHLVVEATLALGARELRVEESGLDVCVAGADYAIGAPSGTSLVTYSPEVQVRMLERARPPRASYLDLLQLQAYWSPERLNHHTAPTSLVYGLREALRLVQLEGLARRWARHDEQGVELRNSLTSLGLSVSGDLPYSVIQLAPPVDDANLRQRLLEDFGVHVTRLAPGRWRLGLLGADARPETVHTVLAALEKVLAA